MFTTYFTSSPAQFVMQFTCHSARLGHWTWTFDIDIDIDIDIANIYKNKIPTNINLN